MRNILKKIAVRIIPIGIMAFLIVSAIAYQRGVYDITFIERPDNDTTTSQDRVEDTSPIDTGTPSSPKDTSSADTNQDETAPPPLTDTKSQTIANFLASLDKTSALISDGYLITDAKYDASTKLTLQSPSITPNPIFSIRAKTILVSERIYDELDSSYTTVMNASEVARPHIEAYMDYILVDNGRTVDVLAKDGTILYKSFDIDKYMPAYTRDKNDHALFKTEEPSQSKSGAKIIKYYFLDETGKLIESDYIDEADNRGLYANYPTYYGKTDNNYYAYYKNGYFGYGNQNKYMSTSYRYKQAYNFSEGFACTIDDNGVVKFIQKWFYAQITNTKIYINSSRRRVYANYKAPDTKGIESIGFFYFDHGLVRVRNQEYDAYHYETMNKIDVTIDEDYIIKSDGKRFPTPPDYTIKGYSDGVILLEKDGYYGFMDYTGKWIADPIYTSASPFNEGLAVVELDGVYGMIDTNGEFVIPLAFDYVGSATGGIVTAYDEGCGWQIFNKMQK